MVNGHLCLDKAVHSDTFPLYTLPALLIVSQSRIRSFFSAAGDLELERTDSDCEEEAEDGVSDGPMESDRIL